LDAPFTPTGPTLAAAPADGSSHLRRLSSRQGRHAPVLNHDNNVSPARQVNGPGNKQRDLAVQVLMVSPC